MERVSFDIYLRLIHDIVMTLVLLSSDGAALFRKASPQSAFLPAVSMGRSIAKMAATMNNVAETNTGALAVFAEAPESVEVVAILINGAMNPPIRLSAEQSASPVPRWGAANASGVYAYRTPYIAFCTRLDAHEYPSTAAVVVLVVNKNIKIADNIVKTARDNFLPPMVHLPTPRV